MADIRDPKRFADGRWKWVEYGYDKGFPRKSTFGDMDAAVEFDGHFLVIEAKHHDARDIGFPYPDAGQMGILRELVKRRIVSFVLYGDPETNDPHALRMVGKDREEDRFEKLLPKPLDERRKRLKQAIDEALGLVSSRVTAIHEDRSSCPCVECIQKRLDTWGLGDKYQPKVGEYW